MLGKDPSGNESSDEYECLADGCEYTSKSRVGANNHLGQSHDEETRRKAYLDELHRLADELGRTPRREDMEKYGRLSRTPYDIQFGGWNDSLKAAGLEVNRDLEITEQKLIADLHNAADILGRPPRRPEIEEYSEYSRATFENYFETWGGALEAADLETWEYPSGEDHPNWTGGKVKFDCVICGDTYLEYPAVSERKKTCGARECIAEYWSQNYSGENSPTWKGGLVDIECKSCGSEFPVKPHAVERRVTCGNIQCEAEYRRKMYSGKDSPRWCRKNTECSNCETPLEIRQYRYDNYDRHFCDHGCHGDWKSEHLIGENSPTWLGGTHDDYGPNWDKQRQKRIEHDGTACIVCGMGRDGHYEMYGCDLNVHHVQRKESFRRDDGTLDYERANQINNLRTLCQVHHKEWEGLPIAPVPLSD